MKNQPETRIILSDEGIKVHHFHFDDDDKKAFEQVMFTFYAFLLHMKKTLGLGASEFKDLTVELLGKGENLQLEGE